jgi:alkylation response protein AidB-like acyl-CoA dehydrogenase
MPAAETLLQRAAEIVPVLRERAEETERQRRVSAETVADLTAAGLFRILKPKRFGGDELDFGVLVRAIAEVSRGCGSTGWVYGLSATSQWILALCHPRAQEEIWSANPDAHIQGAVAPSAVAEKVEGGYRLTGTWNFTSGCDNADWMFVAALLPGEDGARPAPGFLMLPRREFRIDDNWHTVGLCGTGSKNIVLAGAFVPTHRTVGFATLSSGAAPGTQIHANPLYRIPFMAVIPVAIATPALGVAQAALDDFMAMVGGRSTKGAVAGAGSKMAEFGAVQTRVAEAAGLIDAARLLLLRDMDDVLALAASGGVDVARRIRNRRDHALAVKFCVEAVNGLYAATGASGLFLDNRLQRAWRDVNAIAKHISVNWDAVSTMYGQHALGLDPKGQY